MAQSGAELVADVIASLNADGRTPPIPSDPDASLRLVDGNIDSLDLIDLVLAVEARLAEDRGTRVSLATGGTLDPEDHEFATILAMMERADAILKSGQQQS